MSDQAFIEAFQTNYNRIVNYFGSGFEHRFIFPLVSKYTLANQPFSGVMLQKVLEQLEQETKHFPITAASTTSYKLAAQLLLQKTDLKEAICNLIENDKILKEVRFKNSLFRTSAALFLQGDQQQHAIRAKQLFDAMNLNQRILTSNEDIPFVVFLTINNDAQPLAQADTIDAYYYALRKLQFVMGNHLQALAQILTIYSTEYNDTLADYVSQLKEELGKHEIKVSRIHYPFLGVLALAATNDTRINEIAALHQQLMKHKIFKNAKPYALIVAIQKIVQDQIDVQKLIDLTSVSQFVQLLDIADFALEFTSILPSGIADIVDFLN